VEVDDKINRAVESLRRRAINRFEVYGTLSDILRAESKEGTMGSLVRSRESGVSIRVIIDEAFGFAYGSEVTEDLIDSAVTSARYQFKDPHNEFPEEDRKSVV
jgi:predicted Zn-dependent protease